MIISSLLVIFFLGSFAASNDCWWSGCQPHIWTYRGCYPENKYHQIELKPCHGGDMYRCCPKSGGDGDGESSGTDNEVIDNSVIETGICSYYGAAGEIPSGYPTASGEPFDRFAMKAAHKTLPFGTRIRVIHVKSKKSVEVVINDRGPFIQRRIIDLTYGAFGMVEDHDKGLFKCTYSII